MNKKLQLGLKFLSGYLDVAKRPLPDFIIIGAQKAGTSSLFNYLVQHPCVEGSFIKEVQFFTRRHWLGTRGYRAFFPKKVRHDTLFGESTPYYLFHTTTPAQAANLIPGAKLVVLLREPISRAYSHYKHNIRHGYETRSFEESVTADMTIYRESGRLERQSSESEHAYRHHSYARRGLYAEQIECWLKFFPGENLFIGRAEDFFADPSAMTARVIDFLDLPAHPIATDKAHNQYAYKKRPVDEFPQLQEFFRQPNDQLQALTGISW